MQRGLQIETVAGGRSGQRVLRMSGSLGLDTVPDFLKIIRAQSDPVVILDFGGLSYIDSAGVGSLVQTFAAFKKSERRLVLSAVNDRVRAVLEITRVQSLFPSYATVADAEKNLA
jgi:anti-sigma B factor antagonist